MFYLIWYQKLQTRLDKNSVTFIRSPSTIHHHIRMFGKILLNFHSIHWMSAMQHIMPAMVAHHPYHPHIYTTHLTHAIMQITSPTPTFYHPLHPQQYKGIFSSLMLKSMNYEIFFWKIYFTLDPSFFWKSICYLEIQITEMKWKIFTVKFHTDTIL